METKGTLSSACDQQVASELVAEGAQVGPGSGRTMRVAIVGGGIGGMALGLSLLDAGIKDVDIYETVPTVKELGVGINVLPHAVRELTELGLLDELSGPGVPTEELVYFSKHGQRIWG